MKKMHSLHYFQYQILLLLKLDTFAEFSIKTTSIILRNAKRQKKKKKQLINLIVHMIYKSIYFTWKPR